MLTFFCKDSTVYSQIKVKTLQTMRTDYERITRSDPKVIRTN